MKRFGVGIGLFGIIGALSAVALTGAAPPSDASERVEAPEDTDALVPLPEQLPEQLPEPVAALPEVAPPPVVGHGLAFAKAPSSAPGAPAEVASIAVVRAHLVAGKPHKALAAAERYIETHGWSRDRDAAWLLVGMIHREEGRHNAAADAFRRLRVNDRALGALAAWYEAEQDLLRGKPSAAAKECTDYRTKWPDGPHADSCIELIARAHAAQGHERDARAAAKEWGTKHSKHPIAEGVELELATWEVRHDVSRAIPRLRTLAISHRHPLTGRLAEEMLATLHAAGHADAVVPDDIPSRQARAISLRESYRLDESWEAYEALRAESLGARSDNARLVRWVDDQAIAFSWRTRRFQFAADHLAAEYDKKPTAQKAWDVQNALGRAGNWKDAAAWCTKGLERHAGTREWRRKEEDIARVYLLAGDPVSARALLDVAAARPGPTGRRAGFVAGFASYQAKEHEDAITRLTAVIDANRESQHEARYWRAKSAESLGNTADAVADREWLATNAPYSWHGLLVRSTGAPRAAPFGRDGAWPGPELPELPTIAAVPSTLPVASARFVPSRSHVASVGFGRLAWGAPASDFAPSAALLPGPLSRDLSAPPRSYEPGPGYDERKAADEMKKLVDTHGAPKGAGPDALPGEFPILAVIEDLTRVGLYDLSGPLFARFHEDVTKWSRQSRSPHYLASRAVLTDVEKWEPLFLHTRDHNHTARFLWGTWNDAPDADSRLQALRLAWPLAHDRYVWTHGKEHDVDPYLVMGLMRQESMYNPIAESPVGARGAMQIMPTTGHLLADLRRDTAFSAADLEDPVLSVGYGISYLGLLLDRFDGNYPLAVAAYNSGPHNVSRWLKGPGLAVPVDEFVEALPYRETRNYVKAVVSNYGTYVALYAPPGTDVRVPSTITKDDPTVVNF